MRVQTEALALSVGTLVKR